jgi:ADP-ribose pyrophosphatase
MPKEAKTVRRVWEGKYIRVEVADHPHGIWEYARRQKNISAAVILPITDAGELVLVEQYRIPLGCSCIELPAGLIGDEAEGESAQSSAARELEEETGYIARHWHYIGEFASSPGMVGETFHFFKATGLSRVSAGGGVEGEGITVHVVPRTGLPGFLEAARLRGCAIDVRIATLLPLL